ncbi:hypothetical protein [Pararobbsia alpina]|uniref:hypothetical protein n=1 Tax=Pararobbsia alpina TaxID=621374 RepID=UPI0039A4E40E
MTDEIAFCEEAEASGTATPTSTDDAKPTFVLDIDELATGGANLIKYAKVGQASGGNGGTHESDHTSAFAAFASDIRDEAAQLVRNPLDWVREEGSPPGNVAVGVGTSILTAACGLLAVKSGCETVSEASQRSIELDLREQTHRQRLQDLRASQAHNVSEAHNDENESTAIKQACAAERVTLNDIGSARDVNALERGSGFSMIVSGGLTLLKSLWDLGVAAWAVAGNTQSALFVLSTFVGGGVAIIVIGPAVGAGMMALGVFFVIRAVATARELSRDRALMQRLGANAASQSDPMDQRFLTFIEKKFDSREASAGAEEGMNLGFLSGTILGLGSAVGKVALGLAACAGVVTATAATLGLTIIFVTGIAGAVIMGAFSLSFLKTVGKAKTRESYRLAESAYLGRRFDDCQTIHAFNRDDGDGCCVPYGLRAALFQFMSERDVSRQEFLDAVARAMNKYRAWESRGTDDDKTRDRVSKQRRVTKDAAAAVRCARTYLGRLISRSGHPSALSEARQVYARHADRLTVTGLEKWLDGHDEAGAQPGNEYAQRSLLTEMLTMHRNFLDVKARAFEQFSPAFHKGGKVLPQVEPSYSDTVREYERDREIRQRIDTCLNGDHSLSEMKREFLRLQGVEVDDAALREGNVRLNEQLATLLMETQAHEFKRTRGVVFEMQRHALRLEDELHIERDESSFVPAAA